MPQNHAEPSSTEAVLAQLAATLDSGSATPLYQQVASTLEAAIAEGRLHPGERLPSERRLMELLHLSRSTIRIALGELIGRGFISATHGRGNFVQEPPQRRELRFLAIEQIGTSGQIAPSHYELVHAAEQEARTVTHYRYTRTAEELRQTLLHPPEDCHGILIFRPPWHWEEALLALRPKEVPVPFLVVNRDFSGTRLSFVSADHYTHSREATRQLLAKGHRRIGILSGNSAFGYVRQMEAGYRAALEEAGAPPLAEDRLEIPHFDIDTAVEAAASFLAARQFTALVAAGSYPTHLLRLAAAQTGLHIPEQLGVCPVCEPYIREQLPPHWPAITTPDRDVITRSLRALAELARGHASAPLQELLPPDFYHPPCPTPTNT